MVQVYECNQRLSLKISCGTRECNTCQVQVLIHHYHLKTPHSIVVMYSVAGLLPKSIAQVYCPGLLRTFMQPNCWSISQLFFQKNKIFSCWPIWVQSLSILSKHIRVQHQSFLYAHWRVYLEILNSNLGPRCQDGLHFDLSVEAGPKFTEIFLLTYLSTQLIKWALDLTKTDLFRKKMLIVL